MKLLMFYVYEWRYKTSSKSLPEVPEPPLLPTGASLWTYGIEYAINKTGA
jgi:hypothetical protein